MANSRVIKFRAWSTSDEVMIIDLNSPALFYGILVPHADDILMQFTGLLDKNGVEIYEGDIINFTYWWFDGNEAESHLTGTIVYSDQLMSFQLKGVRNKEWERHTGYVDDTEYLTPFSELNFDEADFEIIGNIYQNSELLEEHINEDM